jgi:tRNA 2-(methylsulfanyl)-N6-isopentenyladenosine37 hydroxylase
MSICLPDLKSFLPCETPDEWIQSALMNVEVLLIDHANCEKKAASMAVMMLQRYGEKYDLLYKMSRLAREELRHFEQVLAIMKRRNINYSFVSASRYAKKMHEIVSRAEPNRLIDLLIAGAFIEARSCERFEKISPFLDAELQKFYLSLLKSERRHFQDYLTLAYHYSDDDDYVGAKIEEFSELESRLIQSEDQEFRFHSGVPLKV